MPKANLLDRVEKIIDAARKAAATGQGRSQIDRTVVCTEGYAEPGYDDPKSGIIAFGNWNAVSRYDGRKFQTIDDNPARVAKLLERLGVELEWSDEWACCDGCGKAVRIKPNSYSWRPSYIDDDCGTLVCGDCVISDPTEYLRSLEGRSDACLTLDLDLAECGYVLVESGFEHGLYGGQAADPALVAEAFSDQGITRFLFKLDHSGQFDIDFSVWVHSEDASQITDEGRKVLASGVKRIDKDFLQQFGSFRDWWAEPAENKTEKKSPVAEASPDRTPDEILESSYLRLRSALVDELLERIKGCSPQFFERLVVDLLLAMGYGGSRADAGRAIGKSGDGGIDGIINEDELGLDVICIQAKRWEDTVGRPVVQGFNGSIEGHQARKGVLITTSGFSQEAKEYVKHIERRIVLIDGRQLAEMMIRHNIGVATVQSYHVKRVDADFFVEDE